MFVGGQLLSVLVLLWLRGLSKTGWLDTLLLVLAVLVLFAVWLFRSLKGGSVTKQEEAPTNALEVLKLRLAKGEITLEEYRERKDELEKS